MECEHPNRVPHLVTIDERGWRRHQRWDPLGREVGGGYLPPVEPHTLVATRGDMKEDVRDL